MRTPTSRDASPNSQHPAGGPEPGDSFIRHLCILRVIPAFCCADAGLHSSPAPAPDITPLAARRSTAIRQTSGRAAQDEIQRRVCSTTTWSFTGAHDLGRAGSPASIDFIQYSWLAFCLRGIGGHRHSSAGNSVGQVAGPGGKTGRSIGDHVPLALADQDVGDERRPARPDRLAGGGIAVCQGFEFGLSRQRSEQGLQFLLSLETGLFRGHSFLPSVAWDHEGFFLRVEFRESPEVLRASLSASPSLVMPVLISLCLPGWANSRTSDSS